MNADVVKLAKAFSQRLVAEVPNHMHEIRRRNDDESDPDVCHSHNFTDANMVMYEAWKEVFERGIDLQSDRQINTWNSAWTIAKRAEFHSDKI